MKTRAFKNQKKMKTDKDQAYRRKPPLTGTALFLDKSNAIEMLPSPQLPPQL
jgi:hypothetical protein